jgi:hypothetical protein
VLLIGAGSALAERGFPYGPDALFIASSMHRTSDGKRGALLAAMPRNQLMPLEKALRLAQLRPVGVDRERVRSITNACVRLVDETGNHHGPYYVFSISQAALPNQPWRTGTVYLLPRSPFMLQSPLPFGPNEVHIAQLASLVPVQPVAKLTVTPADFPFLAQIRGHDDQRLQEYATALQTGAPWPKDRENAA